MNNLDLSGKFGYIKYDVRNYLQISNNEYLLLDFVAKMQGRPSEKNPGYCDASADYLAAIIGITKRNYYALCNRIEALGLAERHPKTRKIRVTLTVYDLICGTGDVSSLMVSAGDVSSLKMPNLVMKHHQTGDETSLHNNTVYNTVYDNTVFAENQDFQPSPTSKKDDFLFPLEEKETEKNGSAAPPPPAARPAPAERISRSVKTEHGQVDFPADYTKVAATVFDEVGTEKGNQKGIGPVTHAWKSDNERAMRAIREICELVAPEALKLKSSKHLGIVHITTDGFRKVMRWYFDAAFEYLFKIADDNGEPITTYQPHVVKRCFSQVIASLNKPAKKQPATVSPFANMPVYS